MPQQVEQKYSIIRKSDGKLLEIIVCVDLNPLENNPCPSSDFEAIVFEENHLLLETCALERQKTELEIFEESGFQVEDGLFLATKEEDRNQWDKLRQHLDSKQDQLSKSLNLSWEAVRNDFESQPISVKLINGSIWTTNIGNLREKLTAMGDEYFRILFAN